MEEQQEGVPTELQERRVERTRLGQEKVEVLADDRRDHLRTDSAESRETLGDPSEPGDVDEDQRTFDLAVEPTGVIVQPLAHHPRDVRIKARGAARRHRPRPKVPGRSSEVRGRPSLAA